ncbi:MAG: glycosyltransferase family 39 protein [Chitinophagales bacterium]|nr:glycosyltransferase family 39 protein [Chitinophagales bacterium]MCO5279482.1 glycosyltransferase family 39 protein [Chitinophagales bacterium]
MKALLKSLLEFPTRFFLVVFAGLLFFPFLGNVHLFDWDEINFAESAREMLVTDNWRMVQINFELFHEKPPFFIWLQALSMKIWGVNEYAARFPNAVCGVLTVLIVWTIGRRLYSGRLATYWSLLFCASLLPQFYFKSGIIDPFFNLFIFLGLYFIYLISFKNEFDDRKTFRWKHRWFIILSALFTGLAVLTKGPVAILLIVLTTLTVFIWNRGKFAVGISHFFLWLFWLFVIIFLWIGIEMKQDGLKFIKPFFEYQIRLLTTNDAGHGGPWYYHFVVLLFGCFPASIFAIAGFKNVKSDGFEQDTFRRWMFALLGVVLVVFTIVQTKIVHYSSLAFFPITFFGAYYLEKVMEGRVKFKGRVILAISVVSLLLLAVLIVIPVIGNKMYKIQPFAKADFVSEALNAAVYWSKMDFIPAVIFGILFIASISLFLMQKLKQAIALLLFTTAIFVQLNLVWFAPRIERYSQGALIDFLVEKQNENCRIEALGFKSYAPLFYGKQKPISSYPPDATQYVVTKINRLEEVKTWINADEIGRKNGYVFLKKRNE